MYVHYNIELVSDSTAICCAFFARFNILGREKRSMYQTRAAVVQLYKCDDALVRTSKEEFATFGAGQVQHSGELQL